MSNKRRTGYAYHGPKTPTLRSQKMRLDAAGCEVVFTDTAPHRIERDDMEFAVLEGDTLVVVSAFILGSGARDIAKIVKRICDKGVAIEVLGDDPVLLKTQEEIELFTSGAAKASRQVNAKRTTATRVRSGRKGKLDALSDDEFSYVEWLWRDGRVKQQVIADFANFIIKPKTDKDAVTRVNLAHKFNEDEGE